MFKRLVTVYYYQDVSFSPNTSKPGNKGQLKGLVPTMGESSWEGGGGAGGEVSSGWGGGSPTVTVTFFLALSTIVNRRMMKNPP